MSRQIIRVEGIEKGRESEFEGVVGRGVNRGLGDDREKGEKPLAEFLQLC